ncbi:methyl-accepting chemotaxis protein [Thiohalorhabdus sp. Cl-TMA]|uniref:Methyl-accepting chemotaxis protein n=1 Tax=Thiohalorhabdus methylotrophus TaxID=3242694 RepID=A0ABV4TU76_9GAMM
MRFRLSVFFQRSLRLLGVKKVEHQYLFAFGLIFLLAGMITINLYLSMGASAKAINMAGKQRMLSQRMAKEVLLANQGLLAPAVARKTMQAFEEAHHDLLEGDEEIGLAPIEDPATRAQMRKVGTLWSDYRQALTAFLAAPADSSLERVRELSPRVLRNQDRAVDMLEASAAASKRRQQYLALGLTVAILVVVEVVRSFGLTPLMAQLNQLRDRMESVRRGDFTRPLAIQWADDEMGQLYSAYNSLLENQSHTVLGIQDQSGRLAAASEELVSTAGGIRDNAHDARSQVDYLQGSTRELNQVVQDVAGNIGAVSDATSRSTERTQEGMEAVSNAAERITALKDSSRRVDEIIEAIQAIAKKTDLLALNAAIEAANAGEQGKGFAVVADEVRQLAEQTAHATGQVNGIVGELREHSEASVTAMTDVRDKMGEVLERIEETDRTAGQIAAATEELAATMAENTGNMDDIAGNVDHVAESVTQIESAAQQLEELAQGLQGALGQYRVQELGRG